MTHQQALKILMLSPLYFKLGTVGRMQLVKDYCRLYMEVKRIPKTREVANRRSCLPPESSLFLPAFFLAF